MMRSLCVREGLAMMKKQLVASRIASIDDICKRYAFFLMIVPFQADDAVSAAYEKTCTT
ncbi:hypothetical protein GKZ87_03785 [Erysipelotrichaceae bacterium 66202529]|nr:hypothetical protein GKZ87_03785 [Erysipelotrichaceae bacterium 66202529]